MTTTIAILAYAGAALAFALALFAVCWPKPAIPMVHRTYSLTDLRSYALNRRDDPPGTAYSNPFERK
jgi:hypothetical protein